MTSALSMKETAKRLDIGPFVLFRTLREANILHAKAGTKNLPKRKYIEQGYFQIVEVNYRAGVVPHKALKTLVTPLGLIFLRETLDELDAERQISSTQRHSILHQQSTCSG